MDQIHNPRRKVGFMEEFDQPLTDRGRILRRLEYHRVPFHQAGAQQPQWNSEWKVPRSNRGDYPFWTSQHKTLLVGYFRCHDLTMRHACGAEYILHHVQPFDYVRTS